jgi:DNA-binding MarR family transcriptional regulator
MKDIYCDEGVQLTERALRLAFRAFEDEGVVVVEKSYSDQRLRKIFLTRKFQDLMATHALEIKKKIDESFIVLSK